MNDRSKNIARTALIVVAAIAAFVAIGVGLTRVTASPAVCGSCHEMRAALDSWRASGHTRVGCPQCHEPPREWYQFPQTLAGRTAMLARDVRGHLSAEGARAIAASMASTPTVTDDTCLRCHNESRKITMRFGTLIDHDEHAKRNKSCVSCHYWTAHPDPSAERPMLLMERCFTCHGRQPGAKAPGTCDVCHPKDFNLRPVSHRPASEWRKKHGKVAQANAQPCAICHDKEACTRCHGVEMPHPADWAKGDPPAHAAAAKVGRSVCVRCHTEKPDLCSMCHHKGWEPSKGPWVSQHPAMVASEGAAVCIKCHDPVYCFGCHIRGMKLPAAQTRGSGSD